MKLHHEFTVPTDPADAAEVLHDVNRLAPCMPGATLTSYDGTTFEGTMKVKIGAIKMSYGGQGRFEQTDDPQRIRLVVEGTELSGSGGAQAEVECRLEPAGSGTRVHVDTDLAISGKPAQFGRGVIAEVGDRVIGAFADNVAAELTRTPGADGAATGGDTPRPPAEALDLGSMVGPVIIKRLAPALGGLAVVVAVFLLGRRTRRS